MTDLDAVALELRASAPAAPTALRARVEAIAARTPPEPASWRTWFRPRRGTKLERDGVQISHRS